MKRIFLIPLLTLLCTVVAWGNVAKIGNEEYATLQDAINAVPENAEDETEIVLIGDVTSSTVLHVSSTRKVKLNLNGKGITSTVSGFAVGSNAAPSSNSAFFNEGTLHIVSRGRSVVQKTVNGGWYSAVISNAGRLIIDGGVFIGSSFWEQNIGQAWKNPVIWGSGASSSITINGGTFLCDETYSDHARGPIMPVVASGGGSLVVTGGIFSTSEETYNGHHHAAEDLAGYYDDTKYTTIEIPYTNANVPGYTADRANHIRENNNSGNSNYRTAPKKVCMVVPTGTTAENFLFVQPGQTINVANGETLHVGTGGIVMGDEDSKIIIAAGGKLISEGDIVTSTPDNLHLTMDAVNNKYAQLMIKPFAIQAKHPDATVVLKSKAYKKDGAYTWQRFAVPTYLNGDKSLTRENMLYDHTNYKTALYRWDYESTQENKWTAMDNTTDKFTPFDCYELTTSNTTKGGEYTFKCELVGNGDANLQLDNDRWSYFANSYTAPINIVEMLWELFMNDTYKDNIAASVYVHNRTDENWDLVSFADVLDGNALAHNNIDPMQAFVLWKIADIQDYTLHYEDVIYNPAMGIASTLHPAPARRAQAGMDYQRASIVFSDENGKKDIVKLYEGSDFDNTLNNGFDVEKLMNEGQFSAYIAAEEGEMARLASDSIENATIAMQTKEATTFSMSFENVTLEGYAVRDNLTGTTTEIKEGNIYHFTTPANAVVEGRFQVVAMPKITTAVENVENATATKGIYTLTGIYMGEDFNAVPAGIYIVNGKKMVK